MSREATLRERAHQLIPAGCHTYSKGDDQFPANAPAFISRAKGSYCWDLEGNEFIDWGMGLRAVVLGHAYPAVVDAVRGQLELGSNFTRPALIELELAELLNGLIPSAEMVKLAKNGSDATSAAVRLARAFTGREVILRCRESAFHSFYDWFIGSTVVDSGIPQSVKALTLQFAFNDRSALEKCFDENPGQVAAVILEPAYTVPSDEGYLAFVKDTAHKHGAVLIFDEVITGFRWHLRGAQTLYNVTPDLSCFGKAMGNGFSASALVGRRDIMCLGGTRHDRERVFLLSSTHGGETHAIAAAIATIKVMAENPVVDHLWRIGRLLIDRFNHTAVVCGVADRVQIGGFPCYPQLTCLDHDGNRSAELTTLFHQEMVARGVLMPHVAVSYSHTEAEVDATVAAAAESMKVYRRALENKSAAGLLVGPSIKPVFRRFN
jgi:glutamate-1-semialdehyde 2,1-aminomutase